MSEQKTKRYVYKSSESGAFVSEEYAEANPSTTMKISYEQAVKDIGALVAVVDVEQEKK